MPKVLAERLRAEFQKRGWTQEKLAEAVGISREQCGKHLRKRGLIHIAENTAHGYEQAFSLSRDDLSKPSQEDNGMPSGWHRIPMAMNDEQRLTFRLTMMRYGMDLHYILRMSAVLFIVVAELQLTDRAKRVEAAKVKIDGFPDGFDHMQDAVVGVAQIREALATEEVSIGKRDLTGSTFSDDDWCYGFTGETDLFGAFLKRMLEDLAPDVYRADTGEPDEYLFQDQIEELTQGDALARMVLLKDGVHPEEVAAVPTEERISFLHDRCSEATRAAHREFEAFRAKIVV